MLQENSLGGAAELLVSSIEQGYWSLEVIDEWRKCSELYHVIYFIFRWGWGTREATACLVRSVKCRTNIKMALIFAELESSRRFMMVGTCSPWWMQTIIPRLLLLQWRVVLRLAAYLLDWSERNLTFCLAIPVIISIVISSRREEEISSMVCVRLNKKKSTNIHKKMNEKYTNTANGTKRIYINFW